MVGRDILIVCNGNLYTITELVHYPLLQHLWEDYQKSKKNFFMYNIFWKFSLAYKIALKHACFLSREIVLILQNPFTCHTSANLILQRTSNAKFKKQPPLPKPKKEKKKKHLLSVLFPDSFCTTKFSFLAPLTYSYLHTIPKCEHFCHFTAKQIG